MIQLVAQPTVKPTQVEDGYGLLICNKPSQRCLDDFDVAQAMREHMDDRTWYQLSGTFFFG